MSSTIFQKIILSLVVSVSIFGTMSYAQAKSVTDEKVVDQMLYRKAILSSNGASCNNDALLNPHVSVTYAADIIKAADGSKISDGSTVTPGTDLILRFKPFEYTDIFWFGTGYFYDSPYGEWLPSTQKPAPVCAEKDIVSSKECIGQGCDAAGETSLHIPLVIAPPQKFITQLEGMTCGPLTVVNRASEMRCKVTAQSGSVLKPIFLFKETRGKFYFRFWGKIGGAGATDEVAQCHISNGDPALCGSKNGTDYIYEVEDTSIPFTINVGDTVTTNLQPPVVLARAVGCETYEVSVRGTDPSGSKVRYAFDWDNNGNIDEWLPASGYVNSGTSLVVNKKWSPFDQQFVKVKVYNEGGVSSDWTENSFFIDDGKYCSDLGVNIIATPSTIALGDKSELSWSTVGNPSSCVASMGYQNSGGNSSVNSGSSASGFFSASVSAARKAKRDAAKAKDEGSWSGVKTAVNGRQSVSPVKNTTYVLTCEKGNRTATDAATVDVVAACKKPQSEWVCTSDQTYNDGCGQIQCGEGLVCNASAASICSGYTGPHIIKADPPVVRKGDTTTITWTGPLDACTVTGNGDSWGGKSGSKVTSPVNGESIYTLDCPGFSDKTASVKILPAFQEI